MHIFTCELSVEIIVSSYLAWNYINAKYLLTGVAIFF